MKTTICAAIAAATFAIAPMSASAVTANIGGTPTTVPTFGTGTGENDFIDEIAAAFDGIGKIGFVTSGTIDIVVGGDVTFTSVAAESGFKNFFGTAVDGAAELAEPGTNPFEVADFETGGTESFTKNYGAGSITDLIFSSTSSGSVDAAIGHQGFGIFFDKTFASDFVFLAYDDNGAGEDDNHDDFIVRASIQAIPVPAGFLLIGTAFLAAGAVRRFGRPREA